MWDDSPTVPNIAAIYMTAKKCFGRSQSGHQNAEAHMFLLTSCQNVVVEECNFLIQNETGTLTQGYILRQEKKQTKVSLKYNTE